MENEQETPKRSTGLIIGGFVLVLILIVAGLFLPPISLGERLGFGDEPVAEEPAPTETETETEDAATAAPAGDAATETETEPEIAEFGVTAVDAPPAPPAGFTLQGDAYRVTYATGDEEVALDLPQSAADPRVMDVYAWDGEAWQFAPSSYDAAAGQFLVDTAGQPETVALMAADDPDGLAFGAIVRPEEALPSDLLPTLTELTAGSLSLNDVGELEGEVAEAPTGPYSRFLHVTNVGLIVNSDALAAILGDTANRQAHIDALVEQAVASGFAGVNLDYQGVAADQETVYTAFVSDLADALHEEGLRLIVTLGQPRAEGDGWETGGQNWAALGQVADALYLSLPLNPAAYADNGPAEQMLAAAVRQIDRQKLRALINAGAVDNIGEAYTAMSNEEALAHFGELQFVDGAEEVEPETAVSVALSGDAEPLAWDGASLTYKYGYEQDGQTHQVWLGNAAAFSHRARLVDRYNLGGLAADGLPQVQDGAGYAASFAALEGLTEAPQPSDAAIVWTVRDESDNVLASASGSELTYTWEGAEAEGPYIINAEFALGDSVAELDAVDVVVAAEEGDRETAAAETEETGATAQSQDGEEAAEEAGENGALDPGAADAVVNTGANVRVGPGLGYGTLAGGLEAGSQVALLGRNEDSTWFNILMPDGEQEGWIYAPLVNVNETVEVASLEVVEAPPLTVADPGDGGDTSGGDAGGGDSGSAPPPVVAPVTGNSNFELGGQAFGAPYGMMDYAGMTWIKRQHKWSPGQSGTDVAGVIQEAHNAGFKILLSMPGANLYPDSINFEAYISFLGQVAALPDPPDAIEVWNEQNIDREWPVGQIDPSAYVNQMLAPAYNAIKSANPNIMVVSGAPAPTGFFGGCSGGGCDDAPYMAAMAAAGAASYMDCIGIHYNEGIISPNQTSGDPRTDHYTRYFWGMVNAYYNAFGGSRPLCFTELGYLTPEGYGGLPGGFAWAGNVTVAQQAQWLAEATSLSANSGKVRMLIVWNIDSTTWGDDPQAGYAIIRPGGGCPACESLRQVMGGG